MQRYTAVLAVVVLATIGMASTPSDHTDVPFVVSIGEQLSGDVNMDATVGCSHVLGITTTYTDIPVAVVTQVIAVFSSEGLVAVVACDNNYNGARTTFPLLERNGGVVLLGQGHISPALVLLL